MSAILDNPPEVVAALANRVLPPDAARDWLRRLQRGLLLRPADDGEVLVAEWGGSPLLPTGCAWPEWPGHGPLSYVGALHCQTIAYRLPGYPGPATDTLAFFFFDGSVDQGSAVVGAFNPDSRLGAQVMWIPADVDSVEVSAPQGVRVYRPLALAGDLVTTVPRPDHLAVQQLDDQDPVAVERLYARLGAAQPGPNHRVGGYPDYFSVPPELEVAFGHALRSGLTDEEARGSPAIYEEASQDLFLLAQIDTDARLGSVWGDGGCLYFFYRRSAGPVFTPDAIEMTWQGG
ncbi:MAG TPA: DUF1963 domain-containing protein [Acidimicrobiales bacterium]|nr:DUF1963 domain-containing protein [Acidimicrobiales bacterium]